MYDFLRNFERRMEWFAIASSLINRKGRTFENQEKIENMFSDDDLTNIIVAVLLFIMEKTLVKDTECEFHHIESFLREILKYQYRKTITDEEGSILTRYIVKDVLQNKGEEYIFKVSNYAENQPQNISVRLIEQSLKQKRNYYMLSDQGYNFLYSTYEFNEELKIPLQNFKFKEYIKRGKYDNAIDETFTMLNTIRQKRKELQSFENAILNDIHKVKTIEYEEQSKDIYTLLKEQRESMESNLNLVDKVSHDMKDDFIGSSDEYNYGRIQRQLNQISKNLQLIINEQDRLRSEKREIKDVYMETLKNAVEYSLTKNFDFEEVFLKRIEKITISEDESETNEIDGLISLLRPLCIPTNNHFFNMFTVYNEQILVKEDDETKEQGQKKVDGTTEDELNEKISITNRFCLAFRILTEKALITPTFTLKDLLLEIEENNKEVYDEIIKDKAIFYICLKLYDPEGVDYTNFDEKVLLEPTENFDISYCMAYVRKELNISNLKNLFVEKQDETFNTTIYKENNDIKETMIIEFSNVIFKAVYKNI